MKHFVCLVLVLLLAAAGASAFDIVQVCDPQLGMDGLDHDKTAFAQAVTQINALKPDLVIICGDLVNDPKDKEAQAAFSAILATFAMPVYCLPGNHDIGNEPSAASLEAYRQAHGKDYQAFDHKGWRFVLTNTSLWKQPLSGESEKHNEWFKTTLADAAAKKMPVIVAGHFPPFTETPDEAEAYFNLAKSTRAELLELLKAHGVKACLAGHTHLNTVLDYQGIPIATAASPTKSFGPPLGFRLWHLSDNATPTHEYVPVK